MKFSEIFSTIQGEGAYTGVPSVFFRTSFCNLRCWYCDSYYTSWKPENKEITVEEAFSKIYAYNCKHVVISGGEPFVQSKELQMLCDLLYEEGHHITIETNATIYVPTKAQFISMSPKLSNSTPTLDNVNINYSNYLNSGRKNEVIDIERQTKKWSNRHEKMRINSKVIRQFLDNHLCQVKFVVSTIEDLEEIQQLEYDLEIPHNLITLMPEGITKTEIRKKQQWLVELCIKHGYRYSDRLHIQLWGTKRGV